MSMARVAKTFVIAVLLLVFAQPASAGDFQEAPALSRDALQKLRELAQTFTDTGEVGADITRLFGLGDRPLPTKQMRTIKSDDLYYLSFALPLEKDDIFLFVRHRGKDADGRRVFVRADIYLTNSARTLRGAATVTHGSNGEAVAQLVGLTAAMDGFRHTLRTWQSTFIPADLEAIRARANVTSELEALSAQDARTFGIGNQAFRGKRATYTAPDGVYSMTFLAVPGADDVLLVAETRGATHLYLTDRTTKLRAAAVREPAGLRLLTNAQAEAGYAEALRVWVRFRER